MRKRLSRLSVKEMERAGRKIQDGGDRADARRGSKKHEREAL